MSFRPRKGPQARAEGRWRGANQSTSIKGPQRVGVNGFWGAVFTRVRRVGNKKKKREKTTHNQRLEQRADYVRVNRNVL